MSANLTQYALQRVLYHLGEDVQAPNIKLFTDASAYLAAMDAHLAHENFIGRASARVAVKRVLRSVEHDVAAAWQEAKDAQ